MKGNFEMGNIQALELNIFTQRINKNNMKDNFIKDIILEKVLNILKMENKFIKEFLHIINMIDL